MPSGPSEQRNNRLALPAWERQDVAWLVGIVVIAFAIRAVYVLELRAIPYFHHEIMDQAYHDSLARLFLDGRPIAEGPYFRAPLYPWFLGTLYALTGIDMLAVRLIQALVGSLGCGLVFLIGRAVFPRAVAVAAASACGLDWVLVYFDAELLDTGLSTFLNLVLLLALVHAPHRRGWLPSVGAGLALGVSALSRPNILLFAPFAALWLAVVLGRDRRAWLRATSFAVAVALPIVPVAVRNWVVGDDFVLITSQAGMNLYIGNNPRADGMYAWLPGASMKTQDIGYSASVELAERETGRELKPSEVSDFYAAKTRAFFREQPGAAARLVLAKLRYFWSHYEIPNEKHLYLITERYTPIARFLVVGFWLVGPLGLVGMVACRGRALELFPLWGYVLVYMASVVAFFVNARYRAPIVPVLALLGAWGAWRLWRAIVERQRGEAAGLVAALAVGVALVVPEPPVTMSRSAELERIGATLLLEGRDEEALALLGEAIERDPRHLDAYVTRARALERLGRPAEAVASYEAALAVEPSFAPALVGAARGALERNEPERAAAWIEQAARTIALDADAQFLLARAYFDAGRIEEGRRALDRALEADPARVDAIRDASARLVRAGRFDAARVLAEDAVRRAPAAVEGWTLLCRIRAAAPEPPVRDCAAAVDACERAVRASGGRDPEPLDGLAAARATCGDFPAAVATASDAMRVARERGRADLAEEIATRYRLYLERKPWRLD